ncbi:MAG: hypothetical protein U0637_14850 [Phycisphaerales bacterium]
MRWAAFLLIAWIALGLELSLRKALALGHTGIAPSFVLCAVTVIAASAPAGRTYWLAWVLGLLVDVTFMLPTSNGADARVIGPYAVSLPAGAFMIVSIRTLMYKRSPFAYGFLALVGGLVVQVCVVALYTLRAAMFDPLAWNAGHELWTRLASCVYTGAVMTLLAPLAPVVQRWLQISPSSHISGGTAARI